MGIAGDGFDLRERFLMGDEDAEDGAFAGDGTTFEEVGMGDLESGEDGDEGCIVVAGEEFFREYGWGQELNVVEALDEWAGVEVGDAADARWGHAALSEGLGILL